MGDVHVRDVDDAVIEMLKARAARNRRSLQGELRQILEDAASSAATMEADRPRRPRIRKVSVGGPVYSREAIYEE